MGTLNKVSKPSEPIESEIRHMFYEIDLCALICFFLRKINDSSRYIGTERYICTTKNIQSILYSVDLGGGGGVKR